MNPLFPGIGEIIIIIIITIVIIIIIIITFISFKEKEEFSKWYLQKTDYLYLNWFKSLNCSECILPLPPDTFFQGVEKQPIGNKWVKNSKFTITEHIFLLHFFKDK